jgi:hypothetical protein
VAQALQFLRVFQYGFFPLFGARLLFGMVLDRWGPRVTSAVGAALVMAGVFLFAACDSRTFDAYAPAFFLLGVGSPGPHLASMHVSNLFPSRARSVLTLYSANYSLSGIVFVVFLWVSQGAGVTVRQLFLGYGGVLVLALLTVPMVQPQRTFRRGDRVQWHWRTLSMHTVPAAVTATTIATSSTLTMQPAGTHAGGGDDVDDDSAGLLAEAAPAQDVASPHAEAKEDDKARETMLEPLEMDDGNEDGDDDKDAPAPLAQRHRWRHGRWCGRRERGGLPLPPLPERTLWQQLTSAECLAVAAFLVTLNADLQFYIATMRAQVTVFLGDAGNADADAAGAVSGYTQAFIVAGALGFVAFPLVAYLLERHGFAASFAAVGALIGTHNVLALVPSLPAQYATFLLWSTGRFALFAVYFAYLPEAFGFRYFGTVNGVVSVVLATSALLPYPLTLLVLGPLGGAYAPVNVTWLVIVTLASVAYPLWLHRRHRHRRL